jgi:hypothetical protein
MKKQRLKLYLTGLILLTAVWMAWPEPKQTEGKFSNSTSAQSGNSTKGISWRMLDIGEEENQNRPKNRPSSLEDSGMKRIDRLIAHQTLSNREVAEQLRMIAKDKSIPEKVRTEALGHGVILDLRIFADMAADAQLPIEMAENLLEHVINENRDPALQIRVYTDFMNHTSSEIREEAKDLLAFMLEDDLGEADEATLRQMADDKLKQLESEKPRKE